MSAGSCARGRRRLRLGDPEGVSQDSRDGDRSHGQQQAAAARTLWLTTTQAHYIERLLVAPDVRHVLDEFGPVSRGFSVGDVS